MTSEALALFDAAQASAPQAGPRKRTRSEEEGAAPDFAAMLAQLQPGAMGFQRADISLAIPQRAEASNTPAAQPTDRPRGRDEQALAGDARGAEDGQDAAGRGRDAERVEPRDTSTPRSDTRSTDAVARAAQSGEAAPVPSEARPSSQTQANAQSVANTQNNRTAAEAAIRTDGAAQAASGATEAVQAGQTQAQSQAQQNARSAGPERVQVSVTDAQDAAILPNAQTVSAAAALTAQAQKPARATTDGLGGSETLVPDGGGDSATALLQGQAQSAAARNPTAGRNGEGMTRDGQGTSQTAQAQMQAQAGIGAAANANLPQAATFQATLAASNGNVTGATSATQPVHTLGGESLTSNAAATGQAGTTNGRAGLAAQIPTRPNMPTPPAEQVAVQIQRAVGQGTDRISIQLNPEELGRIEVKLEMKDGRMTALISADRQETLDMLQRDARGLVQTLQNAGLQTDQGSLSFNLRGGDAQAQNQQQGQGGSTPWSQHGGNGAETGPIPAPTFTPPQDLARAGADGRLDVRV